MKYLCCLVVLLGLTSLASAEPAALPRDRQEQIVRDYLHVTGHRAHLNWQTAQAMADSGVASMPIKCGMSAVADFVMNRNRLDRDIRAALGADTLSTRPVLPLSYDSPQGHYKIHYSKTPTDSNRVYQYDKDSDADGVPDYVEAIGVIADSVWDHEIVTLGYPEPPSDGFYPAGDDSLFDIYILNLPGAFYGLSYLDSLDIDGPGGRRATAFMELDNDYKQLDQYANRPLDAVRVTVAHEYFHAVQFGIDYTEAEDFELEVVKRYWMEMSATWMEEEVYDNINDYYAYLPYFFNDPTRSLQQFNGYSDLHPYGAAVFPIFLAQQFGPDVIRETWIRCGEYGRGPHFLLALNNVLDSVSEHHEDITSAFARFALWNFFTGDRANQAPGNIGYEEARFYPEIPDIAMPTHSNFDVDMGVSQTLSPQHMAATYIRLVGGLAVRDQVQIAGDSVVMATPNVGLVYPHLMAMPDTLCVLEFVDSLFLPGTPDGQKAVTQVPLDFVAMLCPQYREDSVTCQLHQGCADTIRAVLDSSFNLVMAFDSLRQPWWITTVGQLRDIPDSFEVEADPLFAPVYPTVAELPTYQPERLCSQTIIISAASIDVSRYNPGKRMKLAYQMHEQRDTSKTSLCGFDSTLVSVKPAILVAYPNPANLRGMTNPVIKIRFRIPTNAASAPSCESPYMTVDLFNLAGERVAHVDGVADLSQWSSGDHEVLRDLSWNARNSGGEQVASGVYIGYARLYCSDTRQDLLAESTVKVAVIR